MRRRKNVCPACGTAAGDPYKTWQLVSPIPDSRGRITITIMGMFECPNCHRKWRGVVSKIKVGGRSVEVEAGGKKIVREGNVKEEKDRAEVIEIDLEDLDEIE